MNKFCVKKITVQRKIMFCFIFPFFLTIKICMACIHVRLAENPNPEMLSAQVHVPEKGPGRT